MEFPQGNCTLLCNISESMWIKVNLKKGGCILKAQEWPLRIQNVKNNPFNIFINYQYNSLLISIYKSRKQVIFL